MGRRGRRANNLVRSFLKNPRSRLRAAVNIVDHPEELPFPGTGDRRQDISFPADELQDGYESLDRHAPSRTIEGEEDKEAGQGNSLTDLVRRQDNAQSGMNMYRDWNESYGYSSPGFGSGEDPDLRLGRSAQTIQLEMEPSSNTRAPVEPGEPEDSQPWVCVDLDGTLLEDPSDEDYAAMRSLESETGQRQQPVLKQPFEGAREFMTELVELGWRTTIWTARFSEDLDPETSQRFADEIEDHLNSFEIPFTDIWVDSAKPRADYYVDNKAIHFGGDYQEVIQALTMLDPVEADQGEEEELDLHGVAISDTVDDGNEFLDPVETRRDRSVRRTRDDTLLNWE